MSFIMRPIRFASTGHIIQGSGLFDGSSGYLSRTPGTAGNKQTFTISAIVKRSALTLGGTLHQTVISTASANNQIRFNTSTDKLEIIQSSVVLATTQVFRDPAAWLHIVLAVDTTQATAANRYKLYVNGTQITDFSTASYPSQNTNTGFNNTEAHHIGRSAADGNRYLNGYGSQVIMIDGLALAPTSFGEVTDDGFWQINDASELTFGTNGFLLEGSASIAGATNQVPDMTSATEPSGTVTTSHETSGQEGFHAFDRNTSGANQWNGNNSGAASLTYQFPSAKQITAYSIQNRDGNTNGAADTWQFQGSNNGSDFTTIQTISSAQSFGAGELKTYFPNNNTSYTHYRINVLTSRANEGPIISEWAMYENIDSSGNNSGWIQTGTITDTNDSPTNDADNGYGNYSTIDPLNTRTTTNTHVASQALTNGNRTTAITVADAHQAYTQTLSPGGKYHVEQTCGTWGSDANGGHAIMILCPKSKWEGSTTGPAVVTSAFAFHARKPGGGGFGPITRLSGSNLTTLGTEVANGNRVTYDIDMSTIGSTTVKISIEGSLISTDSSMAFADEEYVMAFNVDNVARSIDFTMNTGSDAFVDTPVTGHVAVSTATQSTPAIINPDDHFFSSIVDHNGTSTASTCTFNLDTYEWLAIIKNTTGAVEKWYWIDSLRGVTKILSSDATTAESTDANVLTVSGTTFTLGSTLGAKDYLVEIHKAGLASATASNEEGSINTTSTSFNATSGFSLSIYTGTATNATIGHGLSSAPDLIICKDRDTTRSWPVYHSGNTAAPETDWLKLEAITATGDYPIWNDTAPTSSVFSIGTDTTVNGNTLDYVTYNWHSVEGYSSFGSYEGNGSATDGPMINVGFNPRCALYKWIDGGDSWVLYDDAFDPINGVGNRIHPNKTNIVSADIKIDRLSNGSKIYSADGSVNSASTLIYSYWGGRPLTDGAINQGRADGIVQPYDQAYGGNTIKRVGNFWVHTFTSSGTFTPHKAMDVEYLIIGGGGGGGFNIAGGGGAGGYRTATGSSVSVQDYAITVGAGGAGSGTNNTVGANGGGSVFNSITSLGGGGGGSGINNVATKNGVAGGSGGGGNGDNGGAGGSSSANGNNGGNGVGASSPNYGAGGGGGSGAVGANGTNTAGGAGGAGTSSSIDGTATVRAGGGGGGSMGGTAGVAGSGGAGAATNSNTTAAAATANTGSGGGGGGRTSGSSGATGGAGGSGVVIIKYAIG